MINGIGKTFFVDFYLFPWKKFIKTSYFSVIFKPEPPYYRIYIYKNVQDYLLFFRQCKRNAIEIHIHFVNQLCHSYIKWSWKSSFKYSLRYMIRRGKYSHKYLPLRESVWIFNKQISAFMFTSAPLCILTRFN